MNKITRFAAVCVLAVFGPAVAGAAQPEGLLQSEQAFTASLQDIMTRVKQVDAFAATPQCAVVDALPFRAYTLAEAVEALKPCLNAVAARYGAAVEVKAEGQGLRVLVNGQLPFGSPLVAELERALNSRNGELMGFAARLGTRSAVQDTLDRCILPLMVREILSAEDFLKIYGACIKRDPALRVKDIRPFEGREFAVTLTSAVEQTVLQALNGDVVVNAGSGPVKILVLAYGIRER